MRSSRFRPRTAGGKKHRVALRLLMLGVTSLATDNPKRTSGRKDDPQNDQIEAEFAGFGLAVAVPRAPRGAADHAPNEHRETNSVHFEVIPPPR